MPTGEWDRGPKDFRYVSRTPYQPTFESFHPLDQRVALGTPLTGPQFLDIRHFERKRAGSDGGSLLSITAHVYIPPHRVAELEVTDYAVRPWDRPEAGIVPIEMGAELTHYEDHGTMAIQNPNGERFVVPTGRPTANRMSGFIYTGEAKPAITAGASIHGWIDEDGAEMLEERVYVTGDHEPPPTKLKAMGLKIQPRPWISNLVPDPKLQQETEVTVRGPRKLVELYITTAYEILPDRIINLDLQPAT